MKASAGSLVVARPRATRLRSRATDLCGSLLHFRYEPAARTSFMKALAATKDGSVCSQVSRCCHNVSNGTGTLATLPRPAEAAFVDICAGAQQLCEKAKTYRGQVIRAVAERCCERSITFAVPGFYLGAASDE